MLKLMGKKITTIFSLKIFVYLNLCSSECEKLLKVSISVTVHKDEIGITFINFSGITGN